MTIRICTDIKCDFCEAQLYGQATAGVADKKSALMKAKAADWFRMRVDSSIYDVCWKCAFVGTNRLRKIVRQKSEAT